MSYWAKKSILFFVAKIIKKAPTFASQTKPLNFKIVNDCGGYLDTYPSNDMEELILMIKKLVF